MGHLQIPPISLETQVLLQHSYDILNEWMISGVGKTYLIIGWLSTKWLHLWWGSKTITCGQEHNPPKKTNCYKKGPPGPL